MIRCMTAICPAGPPKLSTATRNQTRKASPGETPWRCSAGRVSAVTEASIMGPDPRLSDRKDHGGIGIGTIHTRALLAWAKLAQRLDGFPSDGVPALPRGLI